jgi:NAD(P)-dependent dehydrogenase (short-subunit alcohol dehydrogenase family)
MMKQVVLITGVAGGIGRATASTFAANGWYVIGVDHHQPDIPLPEVDTFICADVGDEDGWQQVFRQVQEQAGRLDALVNNAGLQICKPLVETTPTEWDQIMAVNLRSVYLAVRHAYPLLRNAKGSIVNISSVHAVATSAGIAAYAASKGGMQALTRALAIELAADNIRVNAVLPGAVDTPMLHAGLSRGHLETAGLNERMQELANRTVIGRIGQPFEIAESILFLADTHRSSFITGQSLLVDGGATARLSTE